MFRFRFSEYGTMLEIRDIHVFRDGRSVIDTRGRRRFRVVERRVRDGYNVASVEFLKDVPITPDQREGNFLPHKVLILENIDFTNGWNCKLSMIHSPFKIGPILAIIEAEIVCRTT